MNLDRFSVAIENDYRPFMQDDVNEEWCECGLFLKELHEDACEDCLAEQEEEEKRMSQKDVDAVIEAFKRAANE